MKLETIKGNNKKNIIIGSMIVLSVVGCLTLTTTRAKYKSVQSLKLASGTVNYKASDLHIVAVKVSEDGTNYTDQTEIPESGYTFNAEKSKCRIPTSTLTGENAPADETIPIEYRDGRVYIGVNQKNIKCYLYFDKYVPLITNSTELIAVIEASTSYKTNTPDFTQVATGAETEDNNGIYRVADGMYGGSSYYWRGAATTNHVIFDNKCWRIVRINGDKSIRLIYNGAVQSENTCKNNGSWDGNIVLSGTKYNEKTDNSSYVGWSYSVGSQRPNSTNPQASGDSAPLRTALESWYSSNISASAKNKVVAGKFCNDRNTNDNEQWTTSVSASQNYAANERTYKSSSASPTLSCPDGDVYSLDVGMITADEVQFAGASGATMNQSYYLYNGQYYWTMSPYMWDGSGYGACVFIVHTNGRLWYRYVNAASYGVRPVINLRPDIEFTLGGNGTARSPYIVQ